MQRYFVTGATGFIGRHLTELLLARGGTVFALVRESSLGRLEALARSWPHGDRVVPVVGDLEAPLLGLGRERLQELDGSIDHFFHLAALYDMSASAHRLEAANVKGTWHAVQLANAIRAGRLHHVSSIAAAGRYPGVFREDMFEEATGLDDPYFRTKHASEKVVRTECRVAWRIYRPGVVVGHSQTGEMDKVDGPYYFFGMLQQLAAALPSGMPMLGLDTGAGMNLVPVDFVARAMDHIAHRDGLDGRTFHLVDPEPLGALDTLDLFARIAGAPRFTARVGGGLGQRAARWMRGTVGAMPLRVAGAALNSLFGIPPRLVQNLDWSTRFDSRQTQEALRGSGIEVPPLESYADRLWRYWEDELDADLRFRPDLARAVRGRRILITGASTGIGRAAALKLGAAGARVLLVARSKDRLDRIGDLIERNGGEAHAYAANLASGEECALLAKRVIDEHGGVDVLVNNAGRSIRRPLDAAYERFHDYERTMQLNYFGALRLTLELLPGMRERRSGQIVNVSSMGVQTGEPRFSAYVASKAALDAFSRAASGELFGDGVVITTIYMPLVRTAMSRPTRLYDLMPELTSAQAADWICTAIVRRPRRISMPGATLTEAAYLAAPRLTDIGMNAIYRASQPDASVDSLRDAASGVVRELSQRLPGPLKRRLETMTRSDRSKKARPAPSTTAPPARSPRARPDRAG
jgi:NAD(P)-dependent dehydrogenase (short-subunit alcohol dehydrogenase family)